jgi:GNAT superfamily N-acetyltransferase
VIQIRDMDATDEYFVGTCSHVHESDEIDACAQRRVAWFHDAHAQGFRAKVALLDGQRVGVLYVLPIEICPWGPLGQDLLVVPCLFVQQDAAGKGAGKALMAEAEKETWRQGRKGLVTMAYYHDFWFMPASFFEGCGFAVAKRRGNEALLWKVLDPPAQAPEFLEPAYHFAPVPGKVVVDLFWNVFCETSDIEAQRVREVVQEFGDAVLLHEYDAHERAVLLCHQRARGIFVNGKEIGWGYEAPKAGIREAISQALLAQEHNNLLD